MKKPLAKQLRFVLDRQDARSFVRQLTDAIRSAIESGYYQDGDVVPTLEELAETAGTSVIVPRLAVEILAKEGLLVPRRGVGSIVRAPKGVGRLGHVVIVTGEVVDNYYNAVVCSMMSRELVKAGYAVSRVSVPALEDGSHDWMQLDTILRGPVSLVVHVGARGGIGRHVLSAGVPTVLESCDSADGPMVIGRLASERLRPVDDFIAHCVRARVRDVCEVTFGFYSPKVAARLRDAGVSAREWHLSLPESEITGPDCVELRMYDEMVRRIRSGKRLPEVYFFNDDYAARGALTAFLAEGVRIPEDVKVVTWTVCGNRLAFPLALTRLESDARLLGVRYAQYLLRLLGGERLPTSPIGDEHRYVIGETFP